MLDIEVISVEDYKAQFTNSKQSSAAIQSAINLTTLQLDSITAGQLGKRWNIEEGQPGYLTEEQKGYVVSAYLLQTQYNLANGMDYSEGSESYSLGSNSMSSTRPLRQQINPLVPEYLQRAGLYYNQQFQSYDYIKPKGIVSIATPNPYDDGLQYFITYSVADLRYLKIDQSPYLAGKYVSVDSNGKIVFVEQPDISEIKEEVEQALEEISEVSDTVNAHTTQIQAHTERLDNLETQTTTLEQNVSNLESSKLEADNIIAGENITLDKDGNNITINSTGGGSGSNIDTLVLEKNIEFTNAWQGTSTSSISNFWYRTDGLTWANDTDLSPYIFDNTYFFTLERSTILPETNPLVVYSLTGAASASGTYELDLMGAYTSFYLKSHFDSTINNHQFSGHITNYLGYISTNAFVSTLFANMSVSNTYVQLTGYCINLVNGIMFWLPGNGAYVYSATPSTFNLTLKVWKNATIE